MTNTENFNRLLRQFYREYEEVKNQQRIGQYAYNYFSQYVKHIPSIVNCFYDDKLLSTFLNYISLNMEN